MTIKPQTISVEFDTTDIKPNDLILQFRQDGGFRVKAVEGKDEKGLMKICIMIGYLLSDDEKAAMVRSLLEIATLEHAMHVLEKHAGEAKTPEERERLAKKLEKMKEDVKESVAEIREAVDGGDGNGELDEDEERQMTDAVDQLVYKMEEAEREADEERDHKEALEGCATPKGLH